ncbi:diguanylate cyclase [Mariprofundus erugo]|uniref:Diguanylate cyclase n=1 Tax=Mariprofundus erugo TaxID=2528639 RepID=A0A5R9GNI6_9PROT|nr:diguanylate cyclase [Mariprofundus erugo]TLS65993.1 diguanylate cyclase [Mariprofundus erugo]TLS76350.1 diguanylate cyclase [Mariprofundus erugo]
MEGALQKSHIDLVSIFTAASNHMHRCTDIDAIMRVGIITSTQLFPASAAAAGRISDDQLEVYEYCDTNGWHPCQLQINGGNYWLKSLHRHKHITIIQHGTKPPLFDAAHLPALAHSRQMLAIPVTNQHGELNACLLLFSETSSPLTAEARALLEQLTSMMAVAIDNINQLAESRRIEEDLEKSVATFRNLVEQIPAITYITTLDRSRLLFVSPQAEEILGYRQGELLDKPEPWPQHIHPDDRDRVLAEIELSMQNNTPFHSEYRIRAKDGRDIWFKDAAATVREHEHDLYLQGVLHDITERKASEKRLMQMAHFDQLTGLANRGLFLDRVDQALAQARRHKQGFAILYLDLDGFKAVNDSLGHKAGDELLTEVAHRLRASVREVDTVARMGGDEFTIILNEVSCRTSVQHVADNLIKQVAQPYHHIGPEYSITLSMGIAFYPDDNMNRDTLIKAADHAMYKAKKNGKNCYFIHQP